jgi:hypothetical protein
VSVRISNYENTWPVPRFAHFEILSLTHTHPPCASNDTHRESAPHPPAAPSPHRDEAAVGRRLPIDDSRERHGQVAFSPPQRRRCRRRMRGRPRGRTQRLSSHHLWRERHAAAQNDGGADTYTTVVGQFESYYFMSRIARINSAAASSRVSREAPFAFMMNSAIAA